MFAPQGFRLCGSAGPSEVMERVPEPRLDPLGPPFNHLPTGRGYQGEA